MKIKSPKERMYYYECSNGKFRLTYFIPREDLEDLVKQKKISDEVLTDYPDGVDLDCNESDFGVFSELYQYRPDINLDLVNKTFFALFSSTKNWQKFRGSDFIPAKDLESEIGDVSATIKEHKLDIEVESPSRELPINVYKEKRFAQSVHQREITDVLKDHPIPKVDPKKDLRHQMFSPIKWTEGESAEEIFSQVQHRRRRKRGDDL